MSKRVTLIRGDGIGPEIMEATLRVIGALDVDIEWDEQQAGAGAFEKLGTPLPEETLASIAETGVALKGPLETPIGAGFRSVNVAIRKHFDLYGNVRPSRAIPGVNTRFSDLDLDLVVIRENTEGAYIGIEHTIPPNRSAAESIILVTRHGSERICKFAFEYARRHNRDKVTLIHKANILKETSGLFLEVGRQVANRYDDIEYDEVIVDAMCMKLVTNPEQYDVIVSTNLFGDILSDLTSGLVGGLGVTPGANIGENCAMFEAVHGTAPDIAGQGKANPTAIMMAAVMMLEHLDYDAEAQRMREATHKVVGRGEEVTGDLGGSASTEEFTDAVLRELGA
ncbi:NAD-dependent isocitrate dehydrogenase [Persicimonas caeni]|jgi:isocitrate dehydrogenase (NAD+)|uniref:NAD-dependent isocitrate dehydrogenase n=1 Tax=Persicimonas caeni TaxID=2292766 RepID=A0A4Y6PR56_PERCE|nr:isocitrate/isopropylmalate family dehydrogenase [Persicimonas caeni]QDG50796.1 NAD-dependent isocitrate dehydrogenase [Persicimonas caeni]QED32017.1 NAD-dependent isocitrate dehydrogenase [Persicimonas caeni]